MSSEPSFFQISYNIFLQYWPMFLKGTIVTLILAIAGTLTGTVIGLLIGVVRTIPTHPHDSTFKKILLKILNIILTIYIEVFRGTPMIVQSMVIFYGVPILFGIKLGVFQAAYFIVSINTGAYMSEFVRGGILSIDKGQFEASSSIGMSHFQTMVNVVMPQVIRNILPATGNEFVINIKDTSVLNVIGVSELFFASKSIAGNNFKYFEVYLITSIIYLICTYSVTQLLRFAERRIEGRDSYTIHGSTTLTDSKFEIRPGRS